MRKLFNNKINEINKNVREAEFLLKESMNFYEDDSMDYNDEEMYDEPEVDDVPEADDVPEEMSDESVESYIDHIRKYSLNGLSALCDNPESEEYQMLKKIFQMCDKKPEKKEGVMEHRLFGVFKNNKNVVFETVVESKNNFNQLKQTLISEAYNRGTNPSDIRLVSENKIIR